MLDQPEIDRTLGDTPQAGSKILGDLGDTPGTPQAGSKTLGDFWESSSKDQAMPAEEVIKRSEDDKEEDLKTSTSGMDAELQEWCLLPELALPFAHLDASDGSILPLDHDEMEELKQHIQSGHLTKSHLRKGRLTAEGPRRIHRRVRDIDKATHTLHIDMAGPLTKSDVGYVYFLVFASDHEMASLDITAALLNAELPPGKVVVLRPPSILYRLGLIPQGFCWRVHRAIYGFREAPSLWQDERTSEMTKVKFKVQGEPVTVDGRSQSSSPIFVHDSEGARLD